MTEDAVVQEVALYHQIFGLESDEKMKLRMRDSLVYSALYMKKKMCNRRGVQSARLERHVVHDSTVHE